MSITPMMQQYHEAKQACPEALLLFRMGDFYELFFDDAKRAAEILGLALTSREKGENATPMAGFPYHQLEAYMARLIAAGQRVAICEQVEDPKQAKGIVRREVTRIVSRGTLTDDGLLDPQQSNYLAAIVDGSPAGLAWVELSTGRFWATVTESARLEDELGRIAPVECLISEERSKTADLNVGRTVFTRRPGWAFSEAAAKRQWTEQFGTLTLEGFGFEAGDGPGIRAAGAILDYLRETQKCGLDHIDSLIPYRSCDTLQIDPATRRSLEMTQTIRDGGRQGSLLEVVDRTVTAMGSRLLREWLVNPLADIARIDARLDAVEELVRDAPLADRLHELLKEVYDVERLLARATTGRASPRDLCFLARTLARLPQIKARLTARRSGLLNDLESQLDLCPELRGLLEGALADDCPLASRDGGFIRQGFRAELDKLRELATGGKQWIANYQSQEATRLGIPTLKVGYNKVFGYYIEVTHAQAGKVPPEYIRRQTVKNAERYVTPQLKDYEEQVLTADDRAKQLEYDLFQELRAAVVADAPRLKRTADVLAQLDVLAALAALARDRNYCRPRVVEEPELKIIDGRHPVLDVTRPAGDFVPNDTLCEPASSMMLLITGPNMAGKSTYIRQTGLIVLLAHMGSFVPAREATIGITDRVFARVGASDELSRGQSTFMVEMTETARILNLASRHSLVILDEIGRGTSTYDGVSLAWAVTEYLHERVGCRTLFATHYHELTDLARSLSGIKNVNVAVREWQDEVVFLHKIIDGPADKSYGIHVARLAGVPREVIERSKEILNELEAEHLDSTGKSRLARQIPVRKGQLQLTLFGPQEHPLLDEIRETELDTLTPLDALARIKQWQDSLANGKESKP